jgi:flagellar hook-basal body complex protein FliE
MNSNMSIDQVLAQMRVMSAKAANKSEEASPGGGADFGSLLKQSLDQVNEIQQEASAMRASFEKGDGDMDLAQVMIAAQKSSLSFEAMVQVRNKLIEAYKDVMNMPI